MEIPGYQSPELESLKDCMKEDGFFFCEEGSEVFDTPEERKKRKERKVAEL